MSWLDRIITLFVQVCEDYQKELYIYAQRHTNYANLQFSDEDAITIYMFGIIEGYTTKRQIYNHAKNYWLDLFPHLPTYEAFVYRINKLSNVFIGLMNNYQKQLPNNLYDQNHFRLIDSMPIIMAHRGRRFKAKVAPQIADKDGYCATKKLFYYGVKLHIVGSKQAGALPLPEIIEITSAGTHDVKAYEQMLFSTDIVKYEIFADKAYTSDFIHIHTTTYTPVKKEKGQENLDATDKLYSSAISSIRQPIESLFNWIEQKVSIQIASKVRSYNGLMVHIFGKLATAMNLLVAKFSL